MIWFWVALWVLLVLGGALVLGLVVRTLWGKAKLLMREVGDASERLAPVTERLQAAAEQHPEPAVFDSPTRLRQERFVAARARERGRQPRAREAADGRAGRHAATADSPGSSSTGRAP